MIQGKKIFQQTTSRSVCQIYELLHDRKFVSFPLNSESESKVDVIVANINGSNFGIENYKTAEEKAVAYLFFLIKNHPFVDGNKRTAVIVFTVVCALNDLYLKKEIPLDSLAVFIERIKEDDHHKVIKMIAAAVFDKSDQIG